MPDEVINDTTQGESGSPASGAEPSAGASPAPESGTVTPLPGDTSAAGQAQPLETKDDQVAVDPIDAALKDLPTVEQLKAEAERGVQYARALQDLRPIAEQAKLQTEKFKSWMPIVDQYSDPTKLQGQLELASQFLKDQVIEGGRSVPDTKGAVEWLDKNSPARADSLMVDLLGSKVVYNDVEDTRLNHVFRQVVGKSVDEVRTALQDLEARPASQVIDKAELEAIPEKFHGIWKGLDPETKELLMDERTSEVAKTRILQNELALQQEAESKEQSAQATAEKRRTDETAFYNEAKADGEKAVDEGLGQILNTILDSTFKDISNDTVTLTGSKDTDVRLRGVVGAVMVTLTDPVKRPYVESLLGLKLDPELDQQNSIYEKATIAARIATRYGDKASADARQLEADNAAQWIRAKGNDLAGQLTEYFSAILGVSNGNRAALLASANGGRQHIQGAPSNQAGNGGQPQFTKPLGAERTAEIVGRFVR